MAAKPPARLGRRPSRYAIIQEELLQKIAFKVKLSVQLCQKSKDKSKLAINVTPNNRQESPKISEASNIPNPEIILDQDLPIQNKNTIKATTMANQDPIERSEHYDILVNLSEDSLDQKSSSSRQCSIQKGETIWQDFILVPNPASNLPFFSCGVCKKAFTKVCEFVYHCIQFCGEIDNQSSSHFIKNNRNVSFCKIQQINQSIKSSIQNREREDQVIETNAEGQIINAQQLPIQQHLSSKEYIINSTEHGHYDQLSLQKEVIIDNIKKKEEYIQNYSRYIIDQWTKKNKSYKFEMNNTYKVAFYSYVILLNPTANQSDILQNHKVHKQSIKNNIKIQFLKHLYKKCCPINTPSSHYLILTTNQFYSYLYSTNNLPEKMNNILKIDLAYLLYLYQNTSYSGQLDKMYPLFKYYIGFIKAYYLSRDIVSICKLCRFKGIVINTKIMRSIGLISKKSSVRYEYNRHHSTCSLYNKGKGSICLSADPKLSNPIFTELVNLEGIEAYTFFCPKCKDHEKQITAQQLMTHIENRHEKQLVTVYFHKCFSSKANKITTKQ